MVQIHLPRCFGGNDDIVVVRGSVPVCYAVSVGVNVVSEVVTIIDGTRQRGARRCRVQLYDTHKTSMCTFTDKAKTLIGVDVLPNSLYPHGH